jgi:hypothetical protein
MSDFVCKGSLQQGTGCQRCSRCTDELDILFINSAECRALIQYHTEQQYAYADKFDYESATFHRDRVKEIEDYIKRIKQKGL